MFQSLETYTGVIRQTSIDSYLYRADLWLFGVEPTVWLSRHSTPLVTDHDDPLVHGGFDPPVLHSQLGRFELPQGAFDSADPLRTRSAVSICLAPILRMRWPKLAH